MKNTIKKIYRRSIFYANNFNYTNRIKVFILLFTLLLLNSIFQTVSNTIGHVNGIQDFTSLYIRRFEEIKKLITINNYATVGYISNKNVTNLLSDFEYARQLYLTQYALAPVLVVNSLDKNITVGNFETASSKEISSRIKDFIVIKDFGNGVMLLRKK